MGFTKTPLKDFFDNIGQQFPIQNWHKEAILNICNVLEGGGDRVILYQPRKIGKNWAYIMGRQLKFWKAINSLLEHFQSTHPYDKEIIKNLVDGGMTEEEVVQLRELTLKAAKCFYGKKG